MLDPALISFVRKTLQSIWMLEILLFVRRRAGQPVSRDELVRELRATPFLIRRVVDHLAGERLVSVDEDGAVRFEPATPELALMCEKLEVASRDRPIALRDAIISSPETKLRDLADAFRFSDKGEKDK